MTDDIAHIESQNRGLQVQTSNQRALLAELDKLMVRLSLLLPSLFATMASSSGSCMREQH
jgi:hypothetical protein